MTTIIDILKNNAGRTPNSTAFIFLSDGETTEVAVSYQQLLDRVRSIACELKRETRKGDRAMLIYQPGIEFIEAFLGCLYAGVIAVPICPPKPRHIVQLKGIFHDCQPALIMTNCQSTNNVRSEFNSLSPTDDIRWHQHDFSEEIDPDAPALSGVEPDAIALLQYTSGSTGEPKGVMISHENIVQNCEIIKNHFELNKRSISVSWLPHYHDMGLIDGILEPLYAGCLGVLLPPVTVIAKPSRWLDAITRYRATHSGAPNFIYDHCVDKISDEQKKSLDLSSLTDLYVGGEPVRPSTLLNFAAAFKEQKFGLRQFIAAYGMAEATLMIAGTPVAEEPRFLSVDTRAVRRSEVKLSDNGGIDVQLITSSGVAGTHTVPKIVDPKTGSVVGEEEIGEIWVSGPAVALGYWQNPDATRQVFGNKINGVDARYLRTGDLGFLHDNEIIITGRLTDLIIIRGENFYPNDIEAVIDGRHEDLRKGHCVAFSVDVDGEERLIVMIEVERSALRSYDSNQIRTRLSASILDYFGLDIYRLVLLRPEQIFRTSSGKVQRKKCKQAYVDGRLEPLS